MGQKITTKKSTSEDNKPSIIIPNDIWYNILEYSEISEIIKISHLNMELRKMLDYHLGLKIYLEYKKSLYLELNSNIIFTGLTHYQIKNEYLMKRLAEFIGLKNINGLTKINQDPKHLKLIIDNFTSCGYTKGLLKEIRYSFLLLEDGFVNNTKKW